MSSSLPCVTAPRQRGLKKPPPLRSMSTTQAPVCEKPELRRPLSIESSSFEAQAEAIASSQPSPVCREISAMSAAMMAESEEQVYKACGGRTSGNETKCANSQGPSAAMYKRTNSNPTGNQDATRPELHRRYSSEDACSTQPAVYNSSNNNNKLAVVHQSKDDAKLHRRGKENSNSLSMSGLTRSSGTSSSLDMETGSLISQQTTAAHHILNASFLAYLRDGQLHQGLENLSRFDDSIVVATLRNGIGEEFVLSAESFQTIIRVTRVLLTGMEASIIKLEAFPKERKAPRSNSIERDQPAGNPAQCIESPKYSKEDMLQMSRSELSKQPPDSWQILSQAIPEVCLPANSLREYFDPADFHPPDGSIVVESISVRDRRDQRKL